MKNEDLPVSRVRFDFSALTVLKVFTAALVAFALIKLASLLLLLFIAVLMAIALNPILEWLVARGVSRSIALGLVILGLLGSVVAFWVFLIPEIADQTSELVKAFPQFQKDLLAKFPDGPIHTALSRTLRNPDEVLKDLPAKALAVSSFAIGGVFDFAVFLITSIYFLAGGKQAYLWISAFFSAPTRKKLDETSNEVSKVIFAYVFGQIITSLLVAIFTFTLLSIFKVPGALSLAALAAVLDVLPIVGFIVSAALTFAMAMTVSSTAGIWVLGASVIYHFVENYLIIPYVYGSRLRLSTLVVVLSFLVAGALAGVPGALVVLPIVATYPIIEKIWLRDRVGERTVQTHEKQESK